MLPRSLVLVVAACAYDAQAALLGDRISYLAYGSNLHPAVFERRRGIKPLAMSPAVAPGWRSRLIWRRWRRTFIRVRETGRAARALRCSLRSHAVRLRAFVRRRASRSATSFLVRCRKLDDDGEIEWAFTPAAAPGPMRIAREADEPTPSERYRLPPRGRAIVRPPGSWCSYLTGCRATPQPPPPILAE